MPKGLKLTEINSQINSQGFNIRITIILSSVCALFCALFFNDVLLLQRVKLMACGKPSGGFSNNPTEGYRIPYPTKNHPIPRQPKERTQPYEQRKDYQKRAGI